MVFTEFLDMVEERFSPDMVDTVIDGAALPHDGVYTAVGYYPHEEIVRLVVQLSRHTHVPVPELVQAFGHHLIGRFRSLYPHMFEGVDDLFDFLAAVDSEIHREVRKLYPNAMLPRLRVITRSDTRMALAYESPRAMEDLAHGLLRGAVDHFGEDCVVTLEEHPRDGDTVQPVFVLERRLAD